MIRMDAVTKRFGGASAPAVDSLTLDIPHGRTCVLIGPSGCGKTTTMKMINRLVEPTSGRIELDGEDVMAMDPVALRRRIGYVIQQVGLFPHMTIGENVATVPRLLGWPAARVRARVDEMLALVGMEPDVYGDRYPRELSGGQRQRVGVARALAADPPVMLMDEPFGALDPITRGRLQTEFLRVLTGLRKTVVLVTHDIDEAIRMGDWIAILRDGRLVQYGTPAEVLVSPADAFVEEFVGTDRALKRLQLIGVAEIAGPAPDGPWRPAVSIRGEATSKDALALMLAANVGALAVVDGDGGITGVITLSAIQEAAGSSPNPQAAAGSLTECRSTPARGSSASLEPDERGLLSDAR
jgi:osmoprotectant transport system ATP-binding protein